MSDFPNISVRLAEDSLPVRSLLLSFLNQIARELRGRGGIFGIPAVSPHGKFQHSNG